MTDQRPDPLPREWLPDPVEPPDAPVWEERIAAIMDAARPRLEQDVQAGPAWWTGLGRIWRPALGTAAAIAALLLGMLVARPAPIEGTAADRLVLSAVAGDGSPAALWEAAGSRADPVLAAIALERGQGR